MNAFIALAKEKGMADLASTVCATGGGAHKFEPDFKREVNMKLNKFDELDSLIRGVEFIDTNNNHQELFYYSNPQVYTNQNHLTKLQNAAFFRTKKDVWRLHSTRHGACTPSCW